MNYFYSILFILCSNLSLAQKESEAEIKKSQQLEKELVIKNKLTRIEVVQFTKTKEWRITGKDIFYFDTNGFLIKRVMTHIDFKGNEKISWTGRYVYSASGICDSVPGDKGIRKAISIRDQYPSCYWFWDHKKFKDGYTEKTNNTKTIYCFKTD